MASCVAGHRAPSRMEGGEAGNAGQRQTATAPVCCWRPPSRSDVILDSGTSTHGLWDWSVAFESCIPLPRQQGPRLWNEFCLQRPKMHSVFPSYSNALVIFTAVHMKQGSSFSRFRGRGRGDQPIISMASHADHSLSSSDSRLLLWPLLFRCCPASSSSSDSGQFLKALAAPPVWLSPAITALWRTPEASSVVLSARGAPHPRVWPAALLDVTLASQTQWGQTAHHLPQTLSFF